MVWTPRWIARVAGVVLIFFGFECLPRGVTANLTRQTGFFSFLVETGGFVRIGAVLALLGLLVLLGSFFIPEP